MEKVTPLCPYFGTCGGCTAQHIPYEVQVENKKRLVIAHLKKNGIADLKDIPHFSSKPYHYRNRMDFAFCAEGLGLRKKEQHNAIVPIAQCVISNEKINTFMKEVQQWFDSHKAELGPFHSKNKSGCLKYCTMRASEYIPSSSITFILNEEAHSLGDHIELIRQFAKDSAAENVLIASIPLQLDESASNEAFPIKGGMNLKEQILGKNMLFSSQGFFQNNTFMAEKMAAYCRKLAEKCNPQSKILIDLYGGAGTFGISMGDLFEKTFIIDNAGPNIECAKMNMVNNSIKGEAIAKDASALEKLAFPKGKEVFLLLDPPRSGMHPKVISSIIALRPETLVYISCNPILMAKELKKFTKHYTVESAAMFDLFPQTTHVEAVVGMVRRGQ